MKRKTTKETLAESFRELAEKTGIDKIRIQDIVENCGYSPATFYRQFKDKYDLIAWDYSNKIARIMDRAGKNGLTWHQTVMEALTYFQKEREYLSNLLIHTGGHDSFIKYMSEIHYNEVISYIERLKGNKNLSTQIKGCIRVYCLGTVCMSCEWILGKVDGTVKEIAEIYEKALPEPLQRILI